MVITAGLVLGWTVGALTEIPEATIAVLTALLAGGIVMNVLNEELPGGGGRRDHARLPRGLRPQQAGE